MSDFWFCFFPLFVAVDAVGILPLFMHLTEGADPRVVRRIIVQSMVTALAVALVFLAVGQWVFHYLGITVADFLIAGGILLFTISLTDVITVEKRIAQVDTESLGVVPIGVPLIVGPAVLTTIFVLVGEYGVVPVVAATVVNIVIAGAVFWLSEPIHRVLGRAGSRALSKLAGILLAAIAVMMVRKGLIMLWQAVPTPH
ncbi:MAG: MarC family protein [Syntrophaceae bacterium]|nr:MarC family protein [Syntrophaceae bacterium]